MAGFGRSKFGREPFGKSDVGGDLVVNLYPEEYILDSAPQGTDPNNAQTNPILQMLKTYAHSVSLRREDIDNLKNIIDYELATDDQLILLGDNFGLDIDQNDPEFLKRSFIANASQWLQLKATDKGYEVRGLASGFNVNIVNFWRIDPLQGWVSNIPLYHQFNLKSPRADAGSPTWLHTDVPPGTYAAPSSSIGSQNGVLNSTNIITGLATSTLFIGQVLTGIGIPIGSRIESIDSSSQIHIGWPSAPTQTVGSGTRLLTFIAKEDSTYAKSSFIQVVFSVTNYINGTNFNTLLDLVIDKITDVVGIHHEFLPPQFLVATLNSDVVTTCSIKINETIETFNFNEFNHFDIVPGDVISCDLQSEDLTN